MSAGPSCMSIFHFAVTHPLTFSPHSNCTPKWHESLKKTCTGYWCSVSGKTKPNIALWRARRKGANTFRCDFCVCYLGNGKMKTPLSLLSHWFPLCLDLLAIKDGIVAFGHNVETGVFQFCYPWTSAEGVQTAYLAVKVPTPLLLDDAPKDDWPMT